MSTNNATLQLGIPAGSLQEATSDLFRARGLQHLVPLPELFPRHRRPRDRVHADPRPGDGPVRGGRHPRRGPHGLRLDHRDRGRRLRGRRAAVLEGEPPPGPLGALRAQRLTGPDRQGPARETHRHRGRRAHQELPRQARRRGQGGVQLGRHRGETAQAGRRHRRGHRNRQFAPRQQPPASSTSSCRAPRG